MDIYVYIQIHVCVLKFAIIATSTHTLTLASYFTIIQDLLVLFWKQRIQDSMMIYGGDIVPPSIYLVYVGWNI